jgi:hypothetical protein
MATAGLNSLTAIDAALKELYSGQAVENLVYQDAPFLAMVPKFTEFVGRNYPQPIITGVPAGRSANFAGAQLYQSQSKVDSFLLTRVSDYAVASVSNEAFLASKSDKGAFLEGLKLTVDGAFRAATLSLNTSIFRAGTGSLGLGTFTTADSTITLSTPSDVVNFEINTPLQAASTDGGASITGDTTLGYIISINRSAGTMVVSLTLGGAAGNPTGWTNATAFYFRAFGDRNAKLSGLAAWLPKTAPTSAAFFGVDRSVDVVRLGGVRYDGSAQNPEEALIDGSSLIAREGGRVDTAVCSYATWASLEKSLGAKVQYCDAKSPANIAFRGIMINGANSTIKVFPDRACPAATAYLLTMDTWKLRSLGDAPQILKYEDGLMTLRSASADSLEVRVGYYAQLGCSAPGWNGVITMPV